MPSGKSGLDHNLMQVGAWLNDTNRVSAMWNEYIKKTWINFKLGYDNYKECLHIIEYDDLCSKREEVIQGIYDFLELPYFKHNFENIINVTPEDDENAYGFSGLHDINSKLEKTSKDPKEILGESLYNKYKNMNLEFWRDHD